MTWWNSFYTYLSDPTVWLSKTLIATLLLVFAWMGLPYFAKNHGVRWEWFLMCYMFGIGVFMAFYLGMVSATGVGAVGMPAIGVLIALTCFGALVGGVTNALIFNSLGGKVVNPGIPVAITSSAGIFVIFMTIGAARLWPDRFEAATIHPWTWAGVLLILAGLVLASLGQGKLSSSA